MNDKAWKTTPWYRHWFGSDYLQLYQHRSAEEALQSVNWLLETIGLSPPARVLDLACGTGRHAVELSRRGFDTCGLDLSWPLLSRAEPGDSEILFNRVRGDMRYLPFGPAAFSLVLSLFTSFGYFDSTEEDRWVLIEVNRVLKESGYFVLDYLNAGKAKRELIPHEETTANGNKISIVRSVDPKQKRIEKNIAIRGEDGVVKHFRESVRLYSENELKNLLTETGFELSSIFGDYHGSSYNEDSPRLILIGIKHG